MRPRILIFTIAYPPLIGGAEVFVQEICTRLTTAFAFHIITGWHDRKLPREERYNGITIHRVGLGIRHTDAWLFPVTACWKALRIRKTGGNTPVLAHGVMASYAGLAATLFSKWTRAPLLITEQSGNLHTDVFRNPVYLWCYRRIYRSAAHIHAISSFIARAIQHNVPGAPSITVIPNGVALDAYARASRGNARTPNTILCVSRLSWEKGVDTVVRAMAIIVERVHGARLTIVGGGPERERLEALVRTLRLEPHIHFTGALPHREIPAQLASHAVFVCASNFEGLGNVFIEAQASAMPVVGTNVGGIPDIVQDGITGLLVPPRDPPALARAVQRLIEDAPLAQSLVAHAQARLPQFSWEHIADQIAAQYRSLLSPPHAPLRLVIATGIYPPDAGGPATYCARLAAELIARGASVQIVTFSDTNENDPPSAAPRVIRVLRSHSTPLRYWRYLTSLVAATRTADAIYSQDPFTIGFLSFLVSRWTDAPYVVKVVGDAAWEYAQNAGITRDDIDAFQHRRYAWSVRMIRGVQRFVCAHSSMIVIPSQYLAGIVRGWGVHRDRMNVVPNAIVMPHRPEEGRAGAARAAARATLGIPDCPTIVSAGRLVPWKGFAELIGIIPVLLHAEPSLQCYIIGDGPGEAALRESIRAMALTDHVHLLGRQPQDRLFQFLQSADCFVLNTWYEGMPHVILEAIAARVPIVTTTAGGNAELLTHGRDALLVPRDHPQALAQAVLEVLRDPRAAAARTQRASDVLSRWTWEHLGAKMEALFSPFRRVCTVPHCTISS